MAFGFKLGLIVHLFAALLLGSVSACSSVRTKPAVTSGATAGEPESNKSKEEEIKDTVGDTTEDSKEDKSLPALQIISDSFSFGKTKVVIANKCAFVNNGVVQGIHKPPYDKVYYLSHENKSCFIWDVKKPYPFTHFTKSPVVIRRPFIKVGTKKILGYNCTVYQDFKDPKKALLKYAYTTEIDAPASLIKGYSGSFGNPASFGMPMLLQARKGGRWVKVHNVVEINKIKVSKNLFDIPKYKEAKDLVNFAFFTPGSEDIEKLFEYHFDKSQKKKTD